MVGVEEGGRSEAIKPLILEQLCTTQPAALPPIGITRLSQFRHSAHITDSSQPAQELKSKGMSKDKDIIMCIYKDIYN